jgi:hypothetical protein
MRLGDAVDGTTCPCFIVPNRPWIRPRTPMPGCLAPRQAFAAGLHADRIRSG